MTWPIVMTWNNRLTPLLNKGSCRNSSERREWVNPLKSRTPDEIMNYQDLHRDIRMIVGGTTAIGSFKKARKTYHRMVQNVQLTGFVSKIAQRESPIIEFSEEDAWRLHHPHDNVLVVSIWVEDYNMHRVLVDNGSSADILYYPTFQQMGIGKEWLILMNAPLVGFGGIRVLPLGPITLSVVVGDYPQ